MKPFQAVLKVRFFSKLRFTFMFFLFIDKAHDKETQNKTPLVLTYNRYFQNISYIVRKHWNILNISRTLKGLFQEEPFTAFKRNRNLKELIGSNCIEDEKVKRAKHKFTIIPTFIKK